MRKILFDSLSRRLAKEEREWRSRNALLEDLRPRGISRLVLILAEHPVPSGLFLLLFASILSILACTVPERYWVILTVQTFRLWPDPSGYFFGLWSVQAAIAVLVYPIVIAFVTILIERSSGSKAALHVYLHYSGAQLAGLCALLLIVEMSLQYFALPYVSVEAVAVWICVDASWFVLNLFLTVNFLYKTLDFIKPTRRFEVTRSYALTVAWPREIRYHLARTFFQGAVEANLLPGPSISTRKEREPSILLGPLGAGMGEVRIEASFSRSKSLLDVHFRPLRWAVRRWLRRSRTFEPASTAGRRARVAPALLIFPLDPFRSYRGRHALCAVENGPKLSWLESQLVTFSFKFGHRAERSRDLTVDDLLNDLANSALASLRVGDVEGFRETVTGTVDIYESILDVSESTDTAGSRISLAQIGNRDAFFQRPLYETWSKRIVSLFEVAVSRISSEDDYARCLINVPLRLYASAKDCGSPEILEHFVQLNVFLFQKLEDWWVRTLEVQQSEIMHGPCQPCVLRPPFYSTHDRMLREFIGSWEMLKNDVIRPNAKARSQWQAIQPWAAQLASHIFYTVAILLDCLIRGDKNAAEWATDVLIKWYVELTPTFDDARQYTFKGELLTVDQLKETWEVVETMVDFGSLPDGRRMLAALDIAVYHLWADVCCTTMYMLAVTGRSCESAGSLPAAIFSAILTGTALRSGGVGIEKVIPCDDAEDLLLCMLRHNSVVPGVQPMYRSMFDGLVERIRSLGEPEMVSGRMYSGYGSNDLDSLRDGQVLTLLLLTPPRWRARGELDEIVESQVLAHNQGVQQFDGLLKEIQDRIETEEALEPLRGIYDVLRAKAGKGSDLTDAAKKLAERIRLLRDIVHRRREEALAAAPISDERLQTMAQWCSEAGFVKASGRFPVNLFRTISYSTELLTERSLVLRGMKKGELTQPPMAPRAANEQEWYRETVKAHAGISVLSMLVQELSPKSVDAGTPESYWNQFKRFVGAAHEDGIHPILILERATIPPWVWEWGHPSAAGENWATPADLTVTAPRQHDEESPRWLFNGVPVYLAPIETGGSLLIILESLDHLEFTRFERGTFVSVGWRPIEGRSDAVDFVVTWRLRMQVRQLPAIRLLYGNAANIEASE